MNQIKAIWVYRFFILNSIKTEFQTRFARSKLGGFWMILHPVAQVAIYALVLSSVLSAKLPGIDNHYAYAIYLMAGTLAWSVFIEIIMKSLTVFVDNGNLLKKMAFPKITLLVVILGTTLISNILLFLAILVVFGLLGHAPTTQILWLPMLTTLVLALSIGLGLLLGVMNVFIRDIGQVTPILLQFWFWLTPIVYTIDMLPAYYKMFFMINPMTSIVQAYQSILVYGTSPNLSSLIYPSLLSLFLLSLSLFVFMKANEEMADVL
ncbi:lipopolysaccharide transport system permease protein [Epsilonproteobacteria bacterium SCGC AD-308-E02]|jgi:lipopolysaccharide transport system permease protein|nr:lipopolysaccharide transport system permease protein [Epsilonproteobacteria bacterium SCGC AD-308-E02]